MKGLYIPRSGDICKYHRDLDDAGDDLDIEVLQYYASKNGKYCMVLSENDYEGFYPVFFLDDPIVNGKPDSGAEVTADSLEFILGGDSK